jgi:hypothetical protein
LQHPQRVLIRSNQVKKSSHVINEALGGRQPVSSSQDKLPGGQPDSRFFESFQVI